MHRAERIWQFWKQDPWINYLATQPEVLSHSPYVTVSTARATLACVRKAGAALAKTRMNLLNKLGVICNSLLAYRETKQVYQITAELARELSKLRMPLKLPMRELRLPRRGCVLDFSEFMGESDYQSLVFLSYDDEATGLIDLDEKVPSFKPLHANRRIQVVVWRPKYTDPQVLISIPADLQGRSVWDAMREDIRDRRECISDGHRQIKERGTDLPTAVLEAQWAAELAKYDEWLGLTPEAYVKANPVVALVVNTLLYLQGDPDVVKTVHPGMRPTRKPKQAPNLEKLARRLDHATPTVQRIGERFTAAIKLYEIEREKMKAEHEARGTKCPHLRAPHPHVYRIGEGRLDVIVKFLGWIGVKGAEVPQVLKEAYAPVITPVK